MLTWRELGFLLRYLALTSGRPVGAKGEGLEGGEGLEDGLGDIWRSGVVEAGAQSTFGSSPPSLCRQLVEDACEGRTR